MTEWSTFLTPAEVDRIAGIDKENRALKAEYRRIYDRCRKRMIVSKRARSESHSAEKV